MFIMCALMDYLLEVYMCYILKIENNTRILIIVVSTPGHLNRFGSGFTLISMVRAVKNDLDADPFNLDRKAVIGEVSIRF